MAKHGKVGARGVPWMAMSVIAIALVSINTRGKEGDMNIHSESDIPVAESVIETVLKNSDWKRQDVSIDRDPALLSEGCRFYRAGNARIPGAGQIRFALALDGTLLGVSGGTESMTRILRRCEASRHDARWWAAFIALYSPDATPRAVFADDELGIGLVNAAGGRYAPPELTVENGVTTIDFFMIRRGTEPVRVRASLADAAGSTLRLDTTPVRPATK
jgi:hypothetical protein